MNEKKELAKTIWGKGYWAEEIANTETPRSEVPPEFWLLKELLSTGVCGVRQGQRSKEQPDNVACIGHGKGF